MARTIHLKAPESMELRRLDRKEVERYVTEMADEALAKLPEGLRPVGVNSVALNQMIPGTNADPGVWVEWTRACCGHRHMIEDFEDPYVEQFEQPGSHVLRQIGGEHLESQLRIQELEHPRLHQKRVEEA